MLCVFSFHIMKKRKENDAIYTCVCWRRKERKKKKKELHHLDSRVEQINVRWCNEIGQIEISSLFRLSLKHTWTIG